MKKDSFVLYVDSLEILDSLSEKQCGQLFKAIRDYAKGNEPKNIDPVVEIAFIPIRNYMDRNAKKYEAKCERARENGRLGGRPKKVDVEATVKVKKKKKK